MVTWRLSSGLNSLYLGGSNPACGMIYMVKIRIKKELWTRYKSSMDCYMYMCKLKDHIHYRDIEERLYDKFYWELRNPIDKAPQTNPDTRPRAT